MKTSDRKIIWLAVITILLNIAVFWFLLDPPAEKEYKYSDAMLYLSSDAALFDYWDDWRVGESVTPKDQDVQELLKLLERQNWEEYSWGVYETEERQTTAVFSVVRQLEEDERLLGRSGNVLVFYQIDLWTGTVTISDPLSSSLSAGASCKLSDEDILQLKELLYRYFEGVSEIIGLNPVRPNFSFRQTGDTPSVYSIALYTWDDRFSVSAIHMSFIRGGTYEYIRDDEGSRLILRYADDAYDQFRVEKGKLIYDKNNSQGNSNLPDGTEYVYADVFIDASDFYGSAATDLNKNGILETVYLGLGYTSGVFSFNIYVKENGEQIYSGMVISPYGEPSFAVKDGAVCVRFEVEGGVKDFTISMEEGKIVLTGENGEKLSVNNAMKQ